MTDDLRLRLQDEVGTDEPAPVEEIMAAGTALRRQRRRQRTAAAAAGLVVLVLVAVLTLDQLRHGAVSVHVVGTPGQATPTGVTPPSKSPAPVLTATEQREVAIYVALLRYEIGQLTPTGTATTPSPSEATFFIQNQLFALVPTARASLPPPPLISPSLSSSATEPALTTVTQAGPIPTALQEAIVNALAPTPIVFVPNVQAVTVPVPSALGCSGIIGAGYVFTLGSVPPTGNQVQVYGGWAGLGVGGLLPGGRDFVYALAHTGDAWMVTVATPRSAMLGGCG